MWKRGLWLIGNTGVPPLCSALSDVGRVAHAIPAKEGSSALLIIVGVFLVVVHSFPRSPLLWKRRKCDYTAPHELTGAGLRAVRARVPNQACNLLELTFRTFIMTSLCVLRRPCGFHCHVWPGRRKVSYSPRITLHSLTVISNVI